jgi:hypothetical protein
VRTWFEVKMFGRTLAFGVMPKRVTTSGGARQPLSCFLTSGTHKVTVGGGGGGAWNAYGGNDGRGTTLGGGI